MVALIQCAINHPEDIPTHYTKEEWLRCKEQVDTGIGDIPLEAVGAYEFFCSYSAGGFPKGYVGNYIDPNMSNPREINVCRHDSLLKQVPKLIKYPTTFECMTYDKIIIPKDSVVYCDPPYQNTDGAGYVKGFDSEKYWEWVRGNQ